MKKGDVLLIQKLPDDTSKLNVTNCFFRGYGSPNCTMSMQYTVVEQTSDDNSFSVLVRRPLTATDREKGMDINSYEADMVFAYTKNNKLESHTRPNVGGTFGAVQLNLMSGKKTGEKIGYKFGFLRHEYAQAIIWTLPVDLLILLARYFKGVPAWADIHLYVFMFLYAVSYISLDTHQGRIGPINPEYSTEMKSISKVHKNYYFVLIGFAAMQMIGGILLRIRRSTKSFSFQAKLKNGHIVGGILTWLPSRGFVLAGSLMFKSKFNDPFLLNAVIAETFLFFVAVGYLEMSRRKSFDEVPVIESSKDLSAYSLTLEDSEKVTDQVMVSMLKHRLTPAQLRAR